MARKLTVEQSHIDKSSDRSRRGRPAYFRKKIAPPNVTYATTSPIS